MQQVIKDSVNIDIKTKFADAHNDPIDLQFPGRSDWNSVLNIKHGLKTVWTKLVGLMRI